MEEEEQKERQEANIKCMDGKKNDVTTKLISKNEISNQQKSERLLDLKRKILSNGNNTQFFISRLHELAFYFSDTAKKGHSYYDDELNITELHIIKVEKARELRKIYLSIFNSTVNKDSENNIGIDFKKVEEDISQTFRVVTRGKLK
ncbi:TPA: hypothetical protein NKP06_004586 [Vibrio parahaemolyticus]|nr:hypothetical protein [Vibrio parahaemolyticus]HCH0825171.1 hypothetical protein [Vibrio parahaemolyticus]